MLDHVTMNQARELKLFGMLQALEDIDKNEALHELTFMQGLGLLMSHEVDYRQNKRLARLLAKAKLRYPSAMVEDINFEHKRAIAPEQLRWLISGEWLLKHQNIILEGKTGIGKTYLACACASLACRKGISTRYFRLSKLLEAMRIAQADGSYGRFTSSLLKVKCLVIDDWGIEPICPERRSNLLEIIDDQYDQRSVVIASQLPVERWHDYIGDQTIADALLDRIVHQAKLFKLQGESMRKKVDSNRSL